MIGAKIGLSQFGPGAIFSQPMQSGRYYFTPNIAAVTTNSALGNGSLRFSPFWVPNTTTIQRIGAEVTANGDAGSKVRLGIYADDGTGRPGALLVDAGTIAGDSATVQEIILGTPLTLIPGVYWSAQVVQVVTTTQPTMRVCSASGIIPNVDAGTSMPGAGAFSGAFLQSGVTGALPSNAASLGASGTMPRCFIKVA